VDEIAKSIESHDNAITLVQRARRMDALYARHWSELCRYIRRYFGEGPPDPEDVAQDAFMRFAAIDNSAAIENPRVYPFRTARNVLIDERRRLASRRASPRGSEAQLHSDDRTPERVLVGRERLHVRNRALRAMPVSRCRSLLLNRPQGVSCAAIARMTGYSESAVKKHIVLALTDLEGALTEAERIGRIDSAFNAHVTNVPAAVTYSRSRRSLRRYHGSCRSRSSVANRGSLCWSK
jgi:RNA polymerase sigma-70 factor (ECF subfamily)